MLLFRFIVGWAGKLNYPRRNILLLVLASLVGGASHTACADTLRERTAKQEAFVYAARDADVEKMKLLLEEGADINAPAGFEGHRTPPALIVAAGDGRVDVAKTLLDCGADVNVKGTDFNSTPLMSAARRLEDDKATVGRHGRLCIRAGGIRQPLPVAPSASMTQMFVGRPPSR